MDEDPFLEQDQKDNRIIEIENDGILSKFEKKDIRTFVHDLYLMHRIFLQVNYELGKYTTFSGKTLLKFKALLGDWKAKYRKIMFEILDDQELELLIYFPDTNLSDLLELIKKMNRYSKIQDIDENKIEVLFEDNNTLTLRNESENFRLIYSSEDLLDTQTPEFRICVYFGLSGGFDDTIDLQRYGSEFVFELKENDDGDFEWFRRYPKIKLVKYY